MLKKKEKKSHQTTRSVCLAVNVWSPINEAMLFQFDIICATVLHNSPIWEPALVQSRSLCVREARVLSDSALVVRNEDVVQ